MLQGENKMKKTLFLTLILSLLFAVVMANETASDPGDGPKDSPVKITVTKAPTDQTPDAAYFGVIAEDINFPKAQELGLSHNYGVLISWVSPESPAWHFRLQEDDVILSINNQKITNMAAFDKVLKSLRADDQITLEIFRDGEEMGLDMTVGARPGTIGEDVEKARIPGKKRLSPGYGGGGWVPMLITLDMTDVNNLISDGQLGFKEYRSWGVLQQGVAGKFPIGKGFMLGGQVTSFSDTKKKQNEADPRYHVWMKYNNLLGGVTLDKRIPFSKHFVGSLGIMVGGAYQEMEFLNTDSNYDWNVMPNTITGTNNTHFLLHKGYLTIQPRAELQYHFLSWLGLRAEVGYNYGYSLNNDWRVQGLSGETYEIQNSPDTTFQGMTITVGPWFGF
jgi:hypothetical protein